MRRGVGAFGGAWLAAGYLFLYLPIALLMVYSFNESRLVTVWTGFSVRWYQELLANDRMLAAAELSVLIGIASATIATVVGTAAAVALADAGRFVGRSVLALLVALPLVMPEVVTGLASLLLFVGLERWIGWPPERGWLTVTLVHATVGAAFVAIVVRARLADLDPALSEAAADLGAPPPARFRRVVLPLIAPAVVAGWLLAFTLSFDDLVLASFVSGPGATTLPMLVFASVRLGVSPQINALGTVIVVVVAVLALIAGRLLALHGRKA